MILRLTIDLDYDLSDLDLADLQEIEWFFNEILSGKDGSLLLHSNKIGDTLGPVKLVKVHSSIHLERG